MIYIWNNGLVTKWKSVIFIDVSDLKDVTTEAVNDLLNISHRHLGGHIVGVADKIDFIKGQAFPLHKHISKWGLFRAIERVHDSRKGRINRLRKHPHLIAHLIREYHAEAVSSTASPNAPTVEQLEPVIARFVDIFDFNPLEIK